MVAAIRQHVIVQAGGKINLQSADLPVGESVEVIVMVERGPAKTAADRLTALRQLRAGLNLDSSRAEKWAQDAESERASKLAPS